MLSELIQTETDTTRVPYTWHLKKSHSQERSLQWRLPGLGSRGRRGGVHQSAHMSGWKANEFGDLITA